MTIALCLKVGDGVVLGADSASSIVASVGGGVYNVYTSAEKIFNLRKGLPIGALTYGLGGLGGRSIASLAKDLRLRLQPGGAWELNPQAYTVSEVGRRVRQYFYHELYVPEFRRRRMAARKAGEPFNYEALGFIVAGFSAGSPAPEVWQVEIAWDGRCTGPKLTYKKEQAGFITWKGEPEALNRLIYGYSDQALQTLVQAGLSADDAVELLFSYAPLAHPAMPIQDAIDLVQYLAQVTVGFVRFRPGAPTVSEPVDVAAITLHEGFRWVRRKHYYPAELNPPETHVPEESVAHIYRKPKDNKRVGAGKPKRTDAARREEAT